MITDEDIIEKFFYFENNIPYPKRVIYDKIKDVELLQYLNNRFTDSESLKETVYRILLHIEKRPLCKYCGTHVCKFKNSVIKNGNTYIIFDETCSSKCHRMLNAVKCRSTKQDRYGDPFYVNKEKAQETLFNHYGVYVPAKNTTILNKMKQTSIEKYGVDIASKLNYIWEKGVNNQIEKYGGCFNKSKTKETNLIKYGNENYSASDIGRKHLSDVMSSDIVRNKVNNTKKKNKTFNTSNPENIIYNKLCTIFSYDDIETQYKTEKYPYCCDFYVKPLDLYIECNFHWTHGGHIFNENNIDDINKLNLWKSKNNKFYNNAIKTWCERDILKINTAKENKLNYHVFYTLDDAKKFLENII